MVTRYDSQQQQHTLLWSTDVSEIQKYLQWPALTLCLAARKTLETEGKEEYSTAKSFGFCSVADGTTKQTDAWKYSIILFTFSRQPNRACVLSVGYFWADGDIYGYVLFCIGCIASFDVFWCSALHSNFRVPPFSIGHLLEKNTFLLIL